MRSPKKLIGSPVTSMRCSMVLMAPENGSNSTSQVKAIAMTGAT